MVDQLESETKLASLPLNRTDPHITSKCVNNHLSNVKPKPHPILVETLVSRNVAEELEKFLLVLQANATAIVFYFYLNILLVAQCN